MSNRKNEAEQVVAEAERQGWGVRRTKHGWLCNAPSGTATAYVAGTAQDRRSLTNSLAALRRHGFRWPPK